MLWLCGIPGNFFEELQESPKIGIDIKYGEITKNYYDHKVDQAVIDAFAETPPGFVSPGAILGLLTKDNYIIFLLVKMIWRIAIGMNMMTN